jgi:hypothetical protein
MRSGMEGVSGRSLVRTAGCSAQTRAIVAVEGQWRVRDSACQIEEFRIRVMESLVPLTIPGMSREDGEL